MTLAGMMGVDDAEMLRGCGGFPQQWGGWWAIMVGIGMMMRWGGDIGGGDGGLRMVGTESWGWK